MIKASELRIGNYFHPMAERKESYYQGLVLTVVGILPEKAVCDKDLITMFYRDDEEKPVRGYKGQFFDYDFLHPIPLTEEWLLRFGFECVDDVNNGYCIETNNALNQSLYCSPGGVLALISKLTGYSDFIMARRIEYVHQLQNLFFSLTGEELVLKPEKEAA